MIITISGTPGSGKSTLAKKLAESLGYERYYIGGIRREIARKHGLTLEELNAIGEKEPWTDHEVDEFVRELGTRPQNMVIESRTGFFLIPQSFKVFIDVEPRIGAERVFKELQVKPEQRNEGSALSSVEDVLKSHNQRRESDLARYQRYYGIDYRDPKNFDLILDTTNLTIEQGFAKLLTAVKQWTAQNKATS